MAHFPEYTRTVEFCVVGGGLAGICAAVAAARNGISVALVHDRPMLGGNASSEIRMWISGARGADCRETGILEEIQLRNLYRNPCKNYSIWDSVLYEIAREEPLIQLFLNTTCLDGAMDGNRLASVRCWQMTTQTYYRIAAALFSDCSGDSVLAPITGARYRHGREARSTYQESFGPDRADAHTMGNSLLLQARECAEPRDFMAPAWAEPVSASQLRHRAPDLSNPAENFWYLELGGTRDTIADAEAIRDELLKLAFGMWNYLKNDPAQREQNARFDLDWVGFLPGKRESRRYVGDYTLTERDIAAQRRFADEVAYGGWPMDDHHPMGFRASGEPPTIFHPAPSPFGIPYRALYSANVDNLFCAGRNISVSHAAFSATRVMGTCALLGQAVGTAAALAARHRLTPRQVGTDRLAELQALLMDQDGYLPSRSRSVSRLSREAALDSSRPERAEAVRSGCDRQTGDQPAGWCGRANDYLRYRFAGPTAIREVRLVFDSDLGRATLPQDGLNRNMGSNRLASDQPVHMPRTLIRAFTLTLATPSGTVEEIRIADNIRRFLLLPVPRENVADVTLTVGSTWGSESVRVFSFEVR